MFRMATFEDDRTLKLYRRLLLQRRLKRASQAEAFRRVSGPLRAQGVRFSRLPPVLVRTALGRLPSLPGKDERIDWSQVRSAVCSTFNDEADRDEVFRAALWSCSDASERLAVVWHTDASGMRISPQDLARHASLILEVGTEIWVCAADGSCEWLIEYSRFDREICFGKSLFD